MRSQSATPTYEFATAIALVLEAAFDDTHASRSVTSVLARPGPRTARPLAPGHHRDLCR